MKNDRNKIIDDFLRQRAEKLLESRPVKPNVFLSEADTLKLIHELEIHQIELVLQNEELQLAKKNADIAAEKYTELYDFAPTGYFTLSREGEMIELNLSAAKMLGKARSELKKRRFALFISKNYKTIFNTFLRDIFKTGAKETCEIILEADNLLPTYTFLSGIALGNTEQCFVTVMDITERKQAEQLLKRSEQLLNATGEMAKVGGWEIDLINQTLTWTKEVYRIHDLDESFIPTVAGTIDFYAPNSKPVISAAVQEAIEFGKMFDLELQIITAKGTLKWLHAVGRAQDHDGKVSRVTGTFQDITERKLISEAHEFMLTCGHPGTGRDFFESLAKFLATLLDMEYVCIDQLRGDGLTAQTLAIYNEGKYETNVTYALKETPCGNVVGKTICCFPENVCNLFPNDCALQDLKAVSYIGTTLWSFDGKAIGLIALIGQKPLKNAAHAEAVLKQIAIRAAGELELKQAKDKLLRSENELLKAQQIAHLGSWYLDLATDQVEWTEELYKMYGFDPALPPPPYNEHQKLFTAESWETLSSSLARTRDTGIPYELELKTLREDGSSGWMWVRGETVLDNDGKTIGLWGAAQDITREKQYNQMITQAVIDSEDKQRLVFAQELHDGLGPMLATIKLFLMSMHNKKAKENIDHLIDRVNEIIDGSITMLKELSLNLSPHILSNHGLNLALEDFLNRMKIENISVKFKSNLSCRLSSPIETGLYRIITELLNNSVKHANATQVNIIIRKTDNNVKLGYSDNGCGFDLDSMLKTSKGNGLFNIINRVKSMDATPIFISSYGNGFSFNAKIKT